MHTCLASLRATFCFGFFLAAAKLTRNSRPSGPVRPWLVAEPCTTDKAAFCGPSSLKTQSVNVLRTNTKCLLGRVCDHRDVRLACTEVGRMGIGKY